MRIKHNNNNQIAIDEHFILYSNQFLYNYIRMDLKEREYLVVNF